MNSSYGGGGEDAIAALIGGGLGIGMLILWLVVVLGVAIFSIYITYRMVKKMGYSGWMVLLVIFFQPIMMIYFAFAKWPVEAKVEELQGGKK